LRPAFCGRPEASDYIELPFWETLYGTEVILLSTYQALEVMLDFLQLMVTLLIAFILDKKK
jgi:hypothetical protein